MSKFDNIYKLIMEGRYSSSNRSARNMGFNNMTSFPITYMDGTTPFGTHEDGTPVINPETEMQVAWRMVYGDSPTDVNYLTGKRMEPSQDGYASDSILWLAHYYGYNRGIIVPIAEYLKAYENNDVNTIEKLKAIGLNEGLNLNIREPILKN